jgi:acetolactate synthase-1/2/3 large subunit
MNTNSSGTMASDSRTGQRTAAHFLLEGMMEAGLHTLFCNLGTDHVTLIEELAAWRSAGRAGPRIVLCPHENVAVHMAGGYAAVTGEGQAVLVHVDAGTANSAMALHNLFRARLPVMLIAGRAPYTVRGELTGSRDNYVHFVQDPFDIGSLVRPYVKWEYTLPDGLVAKEVVRRAHSVMQSDPPGPVFLALPRETLARQSAEADARSFPAALYGPVRQGGLDPQALDAVADRLLQAQRPVVITSYLGRSAAAVAALQDLAATCALPVYEASPTVLNIARSSPWSAGYQPDQALAAADLVLLLDVDVPWLPKYTPQPQAECIQIDTDAIKSEFPLWGFGAHTRLQADCGKAVAQIADAIRRRTTPDFASRVSARQAELAARSAARREQRLAQALQASTAADITPAFLFTSIAALLRDEDVVINEGIRNAGAVLEYLPRERAGTYLCNAGGGLGYSGGTALGVRMACPAARVVQIVGDGSFHFCAPTAVYAVAQQYGLPIFSVVLDNGGWKAVKESVLRVHADGHAASSDEFLSRLEGETRDFEKVGEAFGAHAEAVRRPGELEAALRRCLAAVDAGRAAVLRVVLPPL